MPIVLTRIDDRLIHGQVVTAWIKYVKVEVIVVVDDSLANNVVMQQIYKAASPQGVNLYIFDRVESVKYLSNKENRKRTMVLAKEPQILENLIKHGILIKEIILGSMGSNVNRTQLYKNAYASTEERKCFLRLEEMGSQIKFQMVPDEKPFPIKKMLI